MKLPAFDYACPTTLAEAVSLLTPLVMAAADSVTQELVSDLIHEKVLRGISEARGAVRRLFRLGQRGDSGGTEEPGELARGRDGTRCGRTARRQGPDHLPKRFAQDVGPCEAGRGAC